MLSPTPNSTTTRNTCVKFENGKFACSTSKATIDKDMMYDTPTVISEISGTTGERKIIIKMIIIKTTAMISVFFTPSCVDCAKSEMTISLPVT